MKTNAQWVKWLCFSGVAWLTLLACSSTRNDVGSVAAEVQGQCASNADCSNGTVCDTRRQRCVDCNPDNDLCSTGQYCAGRRCAPGCKNNGDCGGEKKTCAVEQHTCFECLADTDCGAGLRCAGRICVPGCSASAPCAGGKSCCDGACVDPTNNMDNCGACGSKCPSHPNGIPACLEGSCTYACVAGFTDCDADATDGCEVDTRRDPTHCGSCTNQCPVRANAAPGCERSGCTYPCVAGYSDCNGDAKDGCEVHSSVDNANCGGCGITCAAGAEQTAACVNGSCNKACLPGFADCDGDPANGCEANLATTATCGTCGNTCTVTYGYVAVCSAGQCLACQPHTKDCDGNPANGCEVNTESTQNCGACGNVCPTFANETTRCDGTQCLHACISDFADNNAFGDCDGNPANGCETSLTTTDNCGTCGDKCQTTNAYQTFCHTFITGTCSPACKPGFADCDGNPANGCERTYNLYVDADGDGYGAQDTPGQLNTCTPPGNGWADNPYDCADNDPTIHPGQTEWFSTPKPNSVIIPVFDYNCDGSVEGIWGANACANGNYPGAWYECNPVFGKCQWNGSSCDFTAGYVFQNGIENQPSCEHQPTYISDCLQSGSTCNAVYSAGGPWGCH